MGTRKFALDERVGGASELQVCPVGIVVGEHGIGVGDLDVRVTDADGGGDEDEVYLLALEGRDVTEVVEGVGGAGVVGRHVVGIIEFDHLTI